MRHGNKNNALGRKKAHRGALMSNMAISLIEHKRIETTLAKAKALRRFVEPLITKSKEDSTHSRRLVFSELQNKDATAMLFRDVAPKIAERPGGYTRIIKLGNRLGDAAEMAMIELVDFNTVYTKEKSAGTEVKKTRRSRRPAGEKAAEAKSPKAEAPKAEEPKAEGGEEAPKAE
jgi:large subunit ribosomal protein L17